MNSLELMRHLAEQRAQAVAGRRHEILSEAKERRVNANLYNSMGLYSIAARETIAAVAYERLATDLDAETVVIL